VFYPDLIAKRKTPEYTLVCMSFVIPTLGVHELSYDTNHW